MQTQKQINIMNDNILSLIHFDVGFALLKLEDQVKKKQSKILKIRSNRILFDANKLMKYLSEVAIQNTFVLKDIAGKLIKIIDINNKDFQELERLESDNLRDFGFSTPFECITIENKEIFYAINSETGYKDFFEQGYFDSFRSQDFAHKCGKLLNVITAAYPSLKQENFIIANSNKKPVKPPNNEPRTFDELFFEQYRKPDIIEACINVLREVEPQVINENNAYTGNYKQTFIIWLKELTGSVIFKEKPQTYSRLLNEKFHGLNMGKSGRSFGSETYASPKYEDYKLQIKNIISRDIKPLLK